MSTIKSKEFLKVLLIVVVFYFTQTLIDYAFSLLDRELFFYFIPEAKDVGRYSSYVGEYKVLMDYSGIKDLNPQGIKAYEAFSAAVGFSDYLIFFLVSVGFSKLIFNLIKGRG